MRIYIVKGHRIPVFYAGPGLLTACLCNKIITLTDINQSWPSDLIGLPEKTLSL